MKETGTTPKGETKGGGDSPVGNLQIFVGSVTSARIQGATDIYKGPHNSTFSMIAPYRLRFERLGLVLVAVRDFRTRWHTVLQPGVRCYK